MKPSSFCTIATKSCSYELVGLILSLSIHHPNAKLYIICDTYTKEYIKKLTPLPKLKIRMYNELDEYTNLDRKIMEERGIFLDFLLNKMTIMKKALDYSDDTLFLDSDIVLFSPVKDIDKKKRLGVSKQYLVRELLEETGYYNAGMIWTNSKTVCNDWKLYTKTKSRYFEQASIEKLVNKHSSFTFGEESNVQCWRYIFNDKPEPFEKYINSSPDGSIKYKGKELVCIHTHFRDKRFTKFNNLIMRHLSIAKRYKEMLVISRFINEKWIIKIPINRHLDSFRELSMLMEEKSNDVSIVKTREHHCWLLPNILLYDWDTLEWCDKEVYNASLLLLGNGDINNEGKLITKNTSVHVKPWIYWPRYPRLLEDIVNKNTPLRYSERSIDSIFIGNIENSVQQHHREPFIKEWSEAVHLFDCTMGKIHKYSPNDYLHKLRNSRYGLCIRGYGSKCHREMELMAFGTVPIVTQDVTTSSFMEPLIENKHFFKVSSPSEFKKIVDTTHKEKWRRMSEACREWYMRNIYSTNAWQNMINHILYT